MARNSSPEADALLDQPIPVLDHGFVRLVDYLGSDDRIVQAARVSYGEGTKTVREDAALIDYLLRNRHTSPFEMVELTLHIKAPIFVARQWLRHRSACLSGEAELYFDQPTAVANGKRKFRRMRVDEFYNKWHNGSIQMLGPLRVGDPSKFEPEREYSVPELARLAGQREESIRNLLREGKVAHKRVEASSPTSPQLFVKGSDWLSYGARKTPVIRQLKERLKEMNLRRCDEETGEIGHTKVRDIWKSGVKPVFEVTLDNGYKLKMTKDHRCLTEAGWMTLERATSMRLREDGGVTWREEAPRFAVNGVPAHRDRTWLAERRAEGLSVSEIAERAGVAYVTIRKSLRKHGLQYSTVERSRLSGRTQRGQRRTQTNRRPFSKTAIDAIRAARSGEKSNFWKGGVSTFRDNIGRWTTEQAPRSHHKIKFPRSKDKPRPPGVKLVRSYAKIVRIEYIGEEMTYDLEVEGPFHNFVANGFVVHNSVNEVSARYSVMAEEFYQPTPDQVRAQGKRSRQVGEGAVDPEAAQRASDSFNSALRKSYETYEELLADDVAREMAREVLPVGLYTEFYWKQDLHNLFHFLRLRMDWHAQFEIRAYGDAVAQCARAVAPRAYDAFEEHILHGRSLSRRELELLREAVDKDRLANALAESGLRPSRQRELLGKLGLDDVPVKTPPKKQTEKLAPSATDES